MLILRRVKINIDITPQLIRSSLALDEKGKKRNENHFAVYTCLVVQTRYMRSNLETGMAFICTHPPASMKVC